MRTLAEYETPITDAYIGDQSGVILTPGEDAMCDFAKSLERKLAMCRRALEGITARYCDLVNSGDAGFWNPETDADVIFARAALEATK